MLEKKAYTSFIAPDGKDVKKIQTRNKTRLESFVIATDGSGRGMRDGLKFKMWPKAYVEDATCVNFSEFNGNEFAQILVEDAETGKLIAITASKLSLHLQEVNDKGEDVKGSTLEAGGKLAEAWRSPGGRASLKDRLLACCDAVEDSGEDIDHFVVHVETKKCRPYASDRAEGKVYSEVQVCTFVGIDADDNEVW